MSGLFEKNNINVNDFEKWLNENEKKPKNKKQADISSFRNEYNDLREWAQPTDNQYLHKFELYKKDRKNEKEKEELSNIKTNVYRYGYSNKIEDKDGNNVYTELGVNRHGGKRKRKTLKRKKSVRKSKKSRKGRKSKKSRKTRRR